MALPAVLRRFEISLADADRGIYEELSWRVPQHPSESERYLVARVIARALEHAEGVEYSPGGVSDDTEPAIVQRDLRGDWVAWIEVGAPTPERLHKATKLVPRVVVYGWKSMADLAAALSEARVHRASEIELRQLDGAVLDAVAATLDRVNKWALSVTGGTLYLSIGAETFESAATPVGVAG
ncbi:MAG TPA: YaeQ family protein [Kofleriaceae bacterium]|jgi:uncharacterized protein YaeQ